MSRIGLDIGGTKIHGVVVDDGGRVLVEHLSRTVPGPEGVVTGALEAVDRLREAVDSAGAQGVGVGVPGVVVDGAVRHAMNLGLGAEPFDLRAELSAHLATPVAVENDLNASALGAAAILGLDDLAYLALGTGIAVGLVLDGRLRRGVSGLAGEVGHLPVELEGPLCPCGQRGCLELYASGSGLARQYPATGHEPLPVTVHAAAQAGEERAVRAWSRLLDGVAEAVQMLVLTLDVGTVVLGGGISRLGEPLLTGVRERLAEREAVSAFLASAGLARRVRLAPADVPVAAVGAALTLGEAR